MIKNTEKEYVDKVESFLNKNGCKTWREVIPNECKDWKFPYKVDLIFYRKDIGYIAVEFKNINTLRQGAKIAKAVEQINNKYLNMNYFDVLNIKINQWCLSFNIQSRNAGLYNGVNNEKIILTELLIFVKHFLKYYNIQLLEFDDYSNKNYNKIIINRGSIGAIYIKNDN